MVDPRRHERADEEAVLEAVPLLLLRPPANDRCLPSCDAHWLLYALGSLAAGLAFFALLGLMSPGVVFAFDGGRRDHDRVVNCSVALVESIPEGLVYNSSVLGMDTFKAWSTLLDKVESNLELASSYWTLLGSDTGVKHNSTWKGETIFKRLHDVADKGVSIRIAQNKQANNDTAALASAFADGRVQFKALDFPHLMGGGILHTKLWVADRKHFYVGSANFDWRSLTQVKEMGVLVQDCPALAEDMGKIWEVYWMLGGKGKKVPHHFPRDVWTDINSANPLRVRNTADSAVLSTFLSSSPPPFAPSGRAVDIAALLSVIDSARDFVHVAVMDYFPASLYTRRTQFWPEIDDRLRRAALERGVHVRILLSEWAHTRPDMKRYLKSLVALNGANKGKVKIEGKFFKVPSFDPSQAAIPYARVNHNKYMVTESTGYVGTSNWSKDYFANTGGIGFVFRSDKNKKDGDKDLRDDLSAVFDRDWNSAYAHEI